MTGPAGPIGLVWNPKSHRISKNASVLASLNSAIPDHIDVVLENFAEIPDQMAKLAQAGTRIILIEGGDGTVGAILSECLSGRPGFEEIPAFGLLPGGMTNLAAKVIGLSKERLRVLMRRLDNDASKDSPFSTMRQRLLTINAKEGAPLIAGFFLSTGAIPDAIEYCRRDVHGSGAQGSMAVGMTLARLVLDPAAKDADGNRIINPSDLIVEADTFTLKGPHLLALATTLPKFNLGLKPFWGEEAGAIRFTYSEEELKGRLRAAATILLRRAGPKMEQHGLSSFNTGKLTLSYQGPLVLDGEYLVPSENHDYVIETSEEVEFLR